METFTQARTSRGRGTGFNGDGTGAGRRLGQNKQWIADHISSKPETLEDREKFYQEVSLQIFVARHELLISSSS
jgi:hypothetical protein